MNGRKLLAEFSLSVANLPMLGQCLHVLRSLFFFRMKPKLPSSAPSPMPSLVSQHEQKDSLEFPGYATFSRTTVPLHTQSPPPGCPMPLRSLGGLVPTGAGLQIVSPAKLSCLLEAEYTASFCTSFVYPTNSLVDCLPHAKHGASGWSCRDGLWS